jgi:serine phosphatase RsbU (regulator of sigma subunit)
MAAPTLKAILSSRSGGASVFAAIREHLAPGICIVDASGRFLLGDASAASAELERTAILHDGTTLGYVVGSSAHSSAVALLIKHLAGRDSENRALASEVLHLYREIHLIEELSEQLAPLLNVEAVAHAALEQARKLITATHGSIMVQERADSPLSTAASFSEFNGVGSGEVNTLGPSSRLAVSILERGNGEIVNECKCDTRVLDSGEMLNALMCAPLRAGQRTVGVIMLGNSAEEASYSAGDLKLLNTIALQTAAAIENSFLCAEMVEAARERAAYAAELQAASSVQQLLLASASRPTPGFKVESVYLPASEVGGDFFFVSPGPDGSLTAILGDVSGKGLTAAMRVAMILGAIRREDSHDPGDILSGLNNVLIAQGQLGFTTACCICISLDGTFTLANAGHIAPYICGREIESPPSLPLGIAENQSYEVVPGRLSPGERIVLLSDGVLEARSKSGELYGFDRLNQLTRLSAEDIADTARAFGQEDDITVLTVAVSDK